MAGDFSGGGSNVSATVDEMSHFFSEIRRYAAEDLPAVMMGEANDLESGIAVPSLLSIMFAINSYRVMAYATQPNGGWHRVIQHIDILAAFGFARISSSATVSSHQFSCQMQCSCSHAC